MCLRVWKKPLALVPFFSLNPHFVKKQNKKRWVGGCSVNEAFGEGDGPREDAVGKVHVPAGPGTNPALAWPLHRTPVSPWGPEGWHPEVQVALARGRGSPRTTAWRAGEQPAPLVEIECLWGLHVRASPSSFLLL